MAVVNPLTRYEVWCQGEVGWEVRGVANSQAKAEQINNGLGQAHWEIWSVVTTSVTVAGVDVSKVTATVISTWQD